MASSQGLSTTSTASSAPLYDLAAVKLLVASSTIKATQAAIIALLPLINAEKISPKTLSERISKKQTEPAAVSNKALLNSDVKVQLVYKKLTEATMQQMKVPMGGSSMQPILLFTHYMMEVNDNEIALTHFLDANILPSAIELKETVLKAQPAALDDVDLWKNASVPMSDDEKKG